MALGGHDEWRTQGRGGERGCRYLKDLSVQLEPSPSFIIPHRIVHQVITQLLYIQNGFLGYVELSDNSERRYEADNDTIIDKNEDNYQQVYENDNFEENKSSFGHELIAGGAAFAGFKAFEDHQRKEGTCLPSSTPLPPSISSFLHSSEPPLHEHMLTHSPGKPVSHQFAKELLAGFAGAEVDKLAETKGEDWFDREKAKRHAKENAERMYDEHYVDGQGAERYDPGEYGRPGHFERRGW